MKIHEKNMFPFPYTQKKPTLAISTPCFFVHPIIIRIKEQTIVANMKFFPRRIKTQNENKTF
jgi:hypothetical protein